VIAADDGVMPQTREHLAILELLGVSRGAVALTKIDRVDPARVMEAQAEIEALLAPTGLKAARIFPVNATDPVDPGTANLGRYLHKAAAELPIRRDQRLFRLAVDRVFTLSGHGTVATGTVFSGQIAVGDTINIMPAGTPVRVRGLHVQNRPAHHGRTGQRCAINLAGVETSALARGDWLADPRVFVPSSRIDVRLSLLAPAGAVSPDGAHARRLLTRGPLHVHVGTGHHVAQVVPLETEGVIAGQSTRVQLVFDRPVCAAPGDRLVVRDAQATHTLGGGVVLDPTAPARKRRSPERLRWLSALESMHHGSQVAPLLEAAPQGLKMTDLVRLTGLPAENIVLPEEAVTIDAGKDRFVFHPQLWSDLRHRAIAALARFHDQVPDERGPDIGRLRRIALPEIPDGLWRALIAALVYERLVIRSGPWLHLPEHSVALSDEDQELAQKLQPLILAGKFDPPWVRDLAAACREPEERVREVLRKSVTQGTVFQVVRDLFYDRECIGELAAIITRMARERGVVDAARYRDALGLGRKRTVQILEFFDRVGYTRRVKDSHVLRHDSGWRP
jgi:selenocysteine-specific elongation factor